MARRSHADSSVLTRLCPFRPPADGSDQFPNGLLPTYADRKEVISVLVHSTDAQLARTDAQLARTDAQLARTDAQLARTDAQLAETAAKLDRLAEMYGGVGNNQGAAAEEFYYNSLKAEPVLAGARFDLIDRNVTRSHAGLED